MPPEFLLDRGVVAIALIAGIYITRPWSISNQPLRHTIRYSSNGYEREVGSRYKLVWLRCYTATSLRLKTECENDDLYIMTARHLLCKFATKNYHFNIENKSSHQNRHTPATLLHCWALKRKAHTKIDIPWLHSYIATP